MLYNLENDRQVTCNSCHYCSICGRLINIKEIAFRDTIAEHDHITHNYKCHECMQNK